MSSDIIKMLRQYVRDVLFLAEKNTGINIRLKSFSFTDSKGESFDFGMFNLYQIKYMYGADFMYPFVIFSDINGPAIFHFYLCDSNILNKDMVIDMLVFYLYQFLPKDKL